MITNRILLITSLLLCCSACENMGPFGDANERALAAATDPIALRIAEAADKASAALSDLSRVEQAKHPAAPVPVDSQMTAELNMPVDISWTGDAEPLLRDLAKRINYNFAVLSGPPKTPVVVRIEQKDRPLVEALRNIGEQATQSIDLVVDPSAHKIELHYKISNADTSGKSF